MGESSQENDLQTNFTSVHVKKQSMADFTTQFLSLIVFAANLALTLKVNGMSPEDTNVFPNYIYVYLCQLVAPSMVCFSVVVIWYLRHGTMRKDILKELKNNQ